MGAAAPNGIPSHQMMRAMLAGRKWRAVIINKTGMPRKTLVLLRCIPVRPTKHAKYTKGLFAVFVCFVGKNSNVPA